MNKLFPETADLNGASSVRRPTLREKQGERATWARQLVSAS
jgi:hypothetical protein